jgi:type IV pilus assembly protein PilA
MVKFKAFSLIELMVVVAIVGVLSAVVTPYYRDYVVKSKLTNGLVVLETMKRTATEFYSINGYFPTLVDLELNSNGYAVEDVSWGDMGPDNWDGGNFTGPYVEVQFNSDVIDGQTAPRLAFVGTMNGSNIDWTCVTYEISQVDNSINTKYLPQNCTAFQ